MNDNSTSSVGLVTQTKDIQIVNYLVVASMTLLIYDYCLTLADEVYLIWISKLNLVKILYLLSRYPAFLDVALMVYLHVVPNIPINHCVPLNNAIYWLTMIGVGVAELILLMRTLALWTSSKKVLYGLLSLLTVFFIASLIISEIYLRTVTSSPPPYPSFPGCSFAGGFPIIFVNFVMLIVFETVIMGMTIFRGYRTFRGTTNPLISTLYRDGTMFYVYLFVISLSNVLVLSLGPPDFLELITTFQRVMHSILSCRVVLHIRCELHSTPLPTPPAVMRLGKRPEAIAFATVSVEPDVISDLRGNGGLNV